MRHRVAGRKLQRTTAHRNALFRNMPGDDPGGIIVTILIGIAGGLLGGFIASSMGIGGGNFVNILVATAGAILLLLGYRLIRGRRA